MASSGIEAADLEFSEKNCNPDTVDCEQRRLKLLDILRKEIAAVRSTLDSYNAGTVPSLDNQIPYISLLMNGPGTPLQITVCGTTQSGETTRAATVDLNGTTAAANDRHQEEMLAWAQLVHYLLHSRGRLSKAKKDLKIHRHKYPLEEPFELKAAKAEYLADCKELHECQKLRSLSCDSDPDSSLRMLQIVAPHIEDLHLTHPGPAHFQALSTMPRLRRLQIWYWSKSIKCNDFGPFRWPDKQDAIKDKFTYDLQDPTKAWQFEDIPPSHAGVVYLKIMLPRHIALPLIAQHRRTLREVSLDVDLPSEGPESEFFHPTWSWGCNDLPQRLGELVERYRFDALQLVELHRISKHARNYHGCQQQLKAVRKALAKSLGTRVVVRCNSCG